MLIYEIMCQFLSSNFLYNRQHSDCLPLSRFLDPLLRLLKKSKERKWRTISFVSLCTTVMWMSRQKLFQAPENISLGLNKLFNQHSFPLTIDLSFLLLFLVLCIYFFNMFFELFQSWTTIAQYVHNILKDYPRLRLTHGRKVSLKFTLSTDPIYSSLLLVSCFSLLALSIALLSQCFRFQRSDLYLIGTRVKLSSSYLNHLVGKFLRLYGSLNSSTSWQ